MVLQATAAQMINACVRPTDRICINIYWNHCLIWLLDVVTVWMGELHRTLESVNLKLIMITDRESHAKTFTDRYLVFILYSVFALVEKKAAET